MLPNGQAGVVRFQGAAIRKPLLSVSGSAAKGNLTLFDQEEFGGGCVIPAGSPELQELRAIVQNAKNPLPLQLRGSTYHMKNWVVRTTEPASGFHRQGK